MQRCVWQYMVLITGVSLTDSCGAARSHYHVPFEPMQPDAAACQTQDMALQAGHAGYAPSSKELQHRAAYEYSNVPAASNDRL